MIGRQYFLTYVSEQHMDNNVNSAFSFSRNGSRKFRFQTEKTKASGLYY